MHEGGSHVLRSPSPWSLPFRERGYRTDSLSEGEDRGEGGTFAHNPGYVICSKAWPARRTVPSSQWRPISIMPTGRPLEGQLDREDAGVGHEAIGGLVPGDAAPAGRDPDRAALVATDRHVEKR